MTWFTGDLKDIEKTIPVDIPAGSKGDARTRFTQRPIARTVRRPFRQAPDEKVREPFSATDARARIADTSLVDDLPKSRIPRASAGIPATLLAADVLALVILAVGLPGAWPVSLLFGVLVILSRGAVRQYRPRIGLTVLDDIPRLIGSTLAALGVSLAALVVVSDDGAEAGRLLRSALFYFVLTLVLQTVVLAVARRRRRRNGRGRRALIVGGGRIAETLIDALVTHPELGLQPVAATSVTNDIVRRDLTTPLAPTDMAHLTGAILDNRIDTAILALGDAEAHVDTIIDVHQTGCEILLVPSVFEMHHDGPDVERVRGVPLIRLRPDPTLRLSWWVKRGFDAIVAALGLIVLSVPLAVVALAILIESGRPVMFWQERVGLDGRTFRLCKFRSMRPRSEAESQTTWNIAADPRVSRLGRLLRRSSVDEIPQLWNILRGQMSLVGPRPERPTFVEQFSQQHERYWARHRVPVGLTGLAQVNGLRGDTSIRERARYDNYYIANWSLWLDVKIMMLTAREVLGGRGR